MTVPKGFLGHAVMHSASKILAHTRLRQEPSPSLQGYHFPPIVCYEETAEDKAVLNAGFLESIKSEKTQFDNVSVHVLDVVDAHVRVLEKDVESGTAIILSHPAV